MNEVTEVIALLMLVNGEMKEAQTGYAECIKAHV